ncbi:MAG: hypothetical protein IJ678_03270 [Kiritimatiellae bacterium]|nr:hypothetical protein [Kiritimatiellia bacterium]
MKRTPAGGTSPAGFKESLEVVPVKNPLVRERPLPEDPRRLELELPLRYRSAFARLLRRLLGAAETKRWKLDLVGTAAWRAIDGRKNWGALVDEFAKREKLGFLETRALLGTFMQGLARRGLVAATVRGPASRR